jgi:hypothetical protein
MNDDDVKAAEPLVEGKRVVPTNLERVDLNTMLFVAAPVSGGHPFRPGSVFRIADPAGFETRFRISIADLFGELLDVPKPPGWNQAKQKLESGRLTGEKLQAAQELMREKDLLLQTNLKNGVSQSQPILLDISPPCDFAQRHPRFAKLVAGLMIPANKGIKPRNKDSFRTIRTIKLPFGEDWDSVFCSRFIFTVPTAEPAPELEFFWRLRDPILTDIRYWSASQDARLGYVMF